VADVAEGSHIDEIDRRIIAELQSDGRRPYTQIAPAVGLSEAAVRQRVQRMLESGVMQIVAVTDPRVLGFGRQAMIGLRLEGDTRKVADALAAMAEVEYVVLTAGAIDVLAEVVVEDDERLIELLNDKIRTLPGVLATETTIYLRIHKESYAWGRP
jgi:Lrp/AsnC family transcriptional regulator, regulator for asnA, asnC and gidA